VNLPLPLEAVRAAGHRVFEMPYSANLIAHRGPGGPGEWDGWLYLGWRPAVESGWVVRAWPCATRPGWRYLRSPMNPGGTATIAPGQHRLSHARGLHRGRAALVQVGEVQVLRDPDRDLIYEPVQPGTGTALNIHDVESPDNLAGCIGLRLGHLLELLACVDALVPHQGQRVTLTVIE
jgi:hypothetical protein